MPYLSIPAHLYRHSASDGSPPRFYEGLYEGSRQFALARQPKRCAKPPCARTRLKGASDDRRNVVFLRKIVPTTPQRSSPRTVDQVVQVVQGLAGAFGRASACPSRRHMPGAFDGSIAPTGVLLGCQKEGAWGVCRRRMALLALPLRWLRLTALQSGCGPTSAKRTVRRIRPGLSPETEGRGT